MAIKDWRCVSRDLPVAQVLRGTFSYTLLVGFHCFFIMVANALRNEEFTLAHIEMNAGA